MSRVHIVSPYMRPVLLATTVGLMVLCWTAARRQPGLRGVVIITLDTVRADRVSVYGAMDASMPHLERLAREGVVFDQATSVAPLTLPAHCSLFTGLFPPSHGVRDNSDKPLAMEQTTLAEILLRRGFRTGAFVGSVVLASDRGLAQGFQHYGEMHAAAPPDTSPANARQRRGDAVVDEAIGWLTTVGDSRFLLWVHLYDAHRPYDPPEPYRSRFTDPYIAEIAFADAQIGRLLSVLEARDLLDRTVIVVAGDHGESLGEHGERDHGMFVYQGVLQVPLIIRRPNGPPGRFNQVVRQVDVMPTILELLGISGEHADGVSLVPALKNANVHLGLEAYAESMYPLRFGWSPVHTIRDGRYKFIEAPRSELYDLDADPFEQRNLYDDRSIVAAAMRQRLQTYKEPARKVMGEGIVSAELRERLASLGYVGGERRVRPMIDQLPDLKDCVALFPLAGEGDVPKFVDRTHCR